ncbi:hypothetical protein BY996DRAFT_7281872 [Phakopsora pachyrhizi]|nr:hypothetical protein BY996DRAFT_7281872 [Phakopsora pachyrhizi]
MSTPSISSYTIARSKSTSTFLSALVISLIAAGVQVLLFLVLRTSIKKIYAPRTYLPPLSKRSEPVSSKPWGWILPTIKVPSTSMIPTAGLDAYMYLRFLKMMVFIFGPTAILTCAVLLPLNSVGSIASGLNSFAFGNISETQQIRYVGHLFCAYAVTIWVLYLIRKEMSNYVDLRQKYLTSPSHTDLPQSRTVLVTGVPQKFLSEQALKKLTSNLPGGIKQIWISRELKNLPKIYNERVKCTLMLESAETKICKAAVVRNKGITRRLLPSSGPAAGISFSRELREEFSKDLDPTLSDPANEFVHRKSRPTHRLGFLGLFGRKVDTVDWCKDEIVRLTMEIETERRRLDQHRPHNSAFIEFNDRLGAQIFSQIVLYNKPLRMSKRYVDAAPEDIICVPVAFIGSLSNITSLCATTKWLSWLCNTGHHLQDIIQGILPPILLALIFLILPVILRLIGRYSGVPRISEIELILMTRYYIFLVIHGFVVTTLSSGLTAAIPALSKDPGQAVTILSENLPKASIFFMTYMVTTSLNGAASSLLQVFDLILYYLKLSVFASTPRSVFNICYTMSRPQFGTLFPNTTLLATLGLAYSIIAPIMSLLALFAFSLHWIVYKYLFLFVFDIPPAHDTGGRFFPLAMNHLFIGLYFSQICLTGLFFLARNSSDDPSSIPQGAIMIVLIIATFFCHILIRNSYTPLTMYVPLNMIEDSNNVKNGNSRSTEKEEESRLNEELKEERSQNEDYNIKNGKEISPQNEVPTNDSRRWSSRALPEAILSISNVKRQSSGEVYQESFNSRVIKTRDFAPPDQTQTCDSPNDDLNSPTGLLNRRKVNPSSEANCLSLVEIEKFPEHGRTAFLHPAVWEKVRPIWVPEDPIGLASLEAAGISNSGKVFVTRSPPENAEVIEYERGKTQGIFALPGAIGGAARAAGGIIGEKVLNTALKTNHTMHSRKASAISTNECNDGLSASGTIKSYGGESSKNPLLASIRRKSGKSSKKADKYKIQGLHSSIQASSNKESREPKKGLGGNFAKDDGNRKSEESDMNGSTNNELLSLPERLPEKGVTFANGVEGDLKSNDISELDMTDWKAIGEMLKKEGELTENEQVDSTAHETTSYRSTAVEYDDEQVNKLELGQKE